MNSPPMNRKTTLAERRRQRRQPWTHSLVLVALAVLVLALGSQSSRVSARLGSDSSGSQKRASGIATQVMLYERVRALVEAGECMDRLVDWLICFSCQLVARGFASDIERALRKYHPEIPHGEHRQLAEQLASTFFDDEELKSYEDGGYEKG